MDTTLPDDFEQPFDQETTRNDTDSLYVVRVGYALRKQIGVEGEVGYTHDPHPKVLDFRLNAGSDANALELVFGELRQHPQGFLPNASAHDRVEVLEVKIVERPRLQ